MVCCLLHSGLGKGGGGIVFQQVAVRAAVQLFGGGAKRSEVCCFVVSEFCVLLVSRG